MTAPLHNNMTLSIEQKVIFSVLNQRLQRFSRYNGKLESKNKMVRDIALGIDSIKTISNKILEEYSERKFEKETSSILLKSFLLLEIINTQEADFLSCNDKDQQKVILQNLRKAIRNNIKKISKLFENILNPQTNSSCISSECVPPVAPPLSDNIPPPPPLPGSVPPPPPFPGSAPLAPPKRLTPEEVLEKKIATLRAPLDKKLGDRRVLEEKIADLERLLVEFKAIVDGENVRISAEMKENQNNRKANEVERNGITRILGAPNDPNSALKKLKDLERNLHSQKLRIEEIQNELNSAYDSIQVYSDNLANSNFVIFMNGEEILVDREIVVNALTTLRDLVTDREQQKTLFDSEIDAINAKIKALYLSPIAERTFGDYITILNQFEQIAKDIKIRENSLQGQRDSFARQIKAKISEIDKVKKELFDLNQSIALDEKKMRIEENKLRKLRGEPLLAIEGGEDSASSTSSQSSSSASTPAAPTEKESRANIAKIVAEKRKSQMLDSLRKGSIDDPSRLLTPTRPSLNSSVNLEEELPSLSSS